MSSTFDLRLGAVFPVLAPAYTFSIPAPILAGYLGGLSEPHFVMPVRMGGFVYTSI